MLLWVLVYLACASGVCTLLVLFPSLARAGLPLGLTMGALALAGTGWLTVWITGDRPLVIGTGVVTLLLVVLLRRWLSGWCWLPRQLFLLATLAAVTYIAYSVQQTVDQALIPRLVPVLLLGSLVLVLAEIAAMGLALSYLFEILDVLGRPLQDPDPAPVWDESQPWPLVVLQVPMYNEPVELVGETLAALDRLDYPNYLIQAVDNNTADPSVWQPIQQLCQQLGPRFQFIHLAPWPGFKAGALNEATRRLPKEVDIVGIVDADYLARPGWLRETVPFFQDPSVGFVQTPQHYRDWEDNSYLRGLFHSYRYFFDITMPSRANRDAIIFCGTMGLIRRSVLDEIGGWNEECITEDAEASLRILGRGYRGVYHQVAWGEGLMPLTFDGLKKQRFRWALGGLQILRQHWRELLPFAPHRLQLTVAQRWSYLVGAVQWFGDLLLLAFTLLLLATAIATAAHQRLPVRQITGAVLVIPLLFLIFGLLRAVWAMRRSGELTWGDAVRALRVWFALSWTVALADIRGLLALKASFLRTPKRRGGLSGWLQALRSARPETSLAVAAVAAAAVMEVRALSVTTTLLAVLLLFQAAVYLSAPWASLATEGILITPLRRIYLRSAQNSGGLVVETRSSAAILPVGLALAATAGLIVAFAATSPTAPAPFGGGPTTPTRAAPNQPVVVASPSPSPSPSSSPSATPSSSASASASASASPTPTPTPTPILSPSPTATP
ncbi:MAG TPA: glycosyltransferase [Candidatus Dormibacteraeota bacterium]|nr:glycosyltransferase [Candidatus Dormibacteraeota bacterium]